MKKKKHAFVVVKSIFNDLWVGKTTDKPDEKKIFKDIDKAISHAVNVFFSIYWYASISEMENGECEGIIMQDEYDAIVNAQEDTIEDAGKLQRFYV